MKKSKIYLRLTGKFLLPIVAILIGGAVIGMSASYQYTSNSLKDRIRQDLESRTISIARSVDAWLVETQDDLDFFSKADVFKDALLEKGYLGRSARQSAVLQIQRLTEENPAFNHIYLLDLDKEVVISSEGSSQDSVGILKKHSSLLDDVLLGRNGLSVPIKVSAQSSAIQIFVAVPIRGLSKQIQGAMLADISIETMASRFVHGNESSQKGFTHILTPDGNILASSQVLQDIIGIDIANLAQEMRSAPPWTAVPRQLNTGNDKVLEIGVHLQAPDLILINTISMDKALRPVYSLGRFLGFTWLAIILLVATTLVLLFRSIVQQPLEALSVAFDRVTSGNYTTRIHGDMAHDEVGRLTRSFNAMAEKLETGVRELKNEIAQHQASRQALAESEQRYRQLFSEMSAGFALCDVVMDNEGIATDAILLEINSRFSYNTGLPDEGVIGKKITEIMPHLNRNWFKMFGSVANTGVPAHAEDYFEDLDRFFDIRLFSPKRGQIAIILVDITDRVESEKQRRSMEEQMRQAQKLESLGVLAGGIAHDFNNLLMGILGNVDLALDDLSPASPARRSLDSIETAAKRAADLCRQMLAYSGKGRFVLEKISINELVDEMSHLLEVSISKKVALRLELAEDLALIEADATQIRQIIMNLITNASESMNDESGVISISTGTMECDEAYLASDYIGETPPAGKYCFFEVSDTGCGMDKSTLDKIFDPFFTTKFTGRGLGMSAVLGIVRGHNGSLRVYSEPGKGTTFKVLFPALETKGGLSKKTEPMRLGDDMLEGTVLIVDDEPTVLDVGEQILQRAGMATLTACDGIEALNIFKEQYMEIDCVILDLTMPHMDGQETFRELRRIRKDVRVLLSSGYNQQEVTQRFVGKGLAGFIQKPYRAASLIEAVKSVLSNGQHN